MKKSILLGFLFLFLLIITLLLSLWFFIPSFKNKLLGEYYARKYPNIPRSEFFKSAQLAQSYIDNSRKVILKGTEIDTIQPDGSITKRFSGKIYSAPKELWIKEIGATLSAEMSEYQRAVNTSLRKIAIINDRDERIITIPKDILIKRQLWNYNKAQYYDARSIPEINLNDITIGDYVLFENTTPPMLIVFSQQQ